MAKDDSELIRPGVAAKQLGISTHTLADWADSGIITPLVTPGGHRRYYAADVDRLLQVPTAHRPPLGRLARNNGAASRLGRPLTAFEVAELAGASSIESWAQLAATYQADGSSIRQIAAATSVKRATVAARISRYRQRN